MSDESKLCARLIVAKQPPAMRNLSVQWVDGLRGSVTKRRDTAAKFLAQLKNQSGDYADAHRALIAECDKMLAAEGLVLLLEQAALLIIEYERRRMNLQHNWPHMKAVADWQRATEKKIGN
jgi:hypothetical protein